MRHADSDHTDPFRSSRIQPSGIRSSGSWALVCALAALLPLACGGEPAEETPAFSAVAERDPAEGRSVWVRVLDRDAAPIPGARVYIDGPDDSEIPAAVVGQGEYRLDGLSDDRVNIWVEVVGQRHGLKHPVSNSRATVVLPVGGGLEVAWAVPQLPALPDGSLHLVVATRAEPDLRLEVEVARSDLGSGSFAIPYLPVGEYLASLELWRRTTEIDPGDPDDPVKILPLTAPRVLWIEPRAVTQVVLGEPLPLVPAKSDAS